MVRQTKRFKKGLNKKVLSAILAASMIMTSSSFAFAGTNETEPLNEETQVNAEVQPTTGMEELGDDLDVDSDQDNTESNGIATYAAPTPEETADTLATDPAQDIWGLSITLGDKGAWPGMEGKDVLEFEYAGGNEVKPEVVLKDKNTGYTLVDGQDYHLTYDNCTNVSETVGLAKVTIEFDGGIYGNIGDTVIEYKVVPRVIREKTATVIYATEESLKYNGKVQYPEILSVTIQDGEEYFELGKGDYEIQNLTGDHVSVGTHKIKVVGVGNYKGTIDSEYTYEITPAELSNETSSVSIDPIAFMSNKTVNEVQDEIEKSINVYDGVNDRYLKSSEYTIKYMDEKTGEYTLNKPANADMGVHQVRIYGKLNYDSNSYVDATYEIVKEDSLQMAVNQALKDGKIKINGTPLSKPGAIYYYDGTDKFVDNDEVVIESLKSNQYTVTTQRADWTNAGSYYITLEGKNNFKGDTATIPVYVYSKKLSNDGFYYNATRGTHRSETPGSLEVIVRDTQIGDKGTTLKEGVDYVYEVVKEKWGNDRVYIKGIGNYADTHREIIDVNDKLYLNDESITAEVTKSYVYTGKEVKPTASDIKLVEKDGNNEYVITDADFYVESYRNNINAGEATLIIKAKDESKYYTGSREITFTIGGLDFAETFEFAPISDVEVGADWADVLKQIKVEYQSNGAVYASYNNPQNRCEFEILKDGKKVTKTELENKDGISESGEYVVKATPIGNRYAGTLETTFTVKGVDVAQNTKVADIPDQVYTGEAIEPEVTVTNDNMTLEAGKDYTVSYSGNVEGGTAVAIITGIGNYSGTIEKKFTITQGQQKITMTNPLQERDLKNGTRTTTSKACTLKLGYALEDKNLNLTYATSDPSVATVSNGKITYQGVGECIITVTANETNNCKADTLEIQVKVGKPGTPTFTPTVTKNTAKKAFVVTSSTVKGAEGFEVQYSIRSDWWKATTKDFDKVSAGGKLYRQTLTTYHSNRTYFVRVRAYEVVDGQKVYSDWSPVKTVVTK